MNTYKTGVKQFTQFCCILNINPLPLSEQVLENFVTSISRRVGAKTILCYLCGVQYWSKLQGCQVIIADMVRLPYVIRGIRRWQGKSHTRPVRRPITIHLLTIILQYIDTKFVHCDRLMYRAAVLTAFFGMLRVSEYTAPSRSSYDPELHLTINDVSFSDSFRVVCLVLKSSKTDPFRAGVCVRIGSTNDQFCPVLAMTQYLASRPRASGPLFIFRDCSHFTRSNVRDLLRHSLPNVADVSSHSFRRGGASALANAGMPHHVIQILGRWRSDAYRLYVHFPDSFIRQVSLTVASRFHQ